MSALSDKLIEAIEDGREDEFREVFDRCKCGNNGGADCEYCLKREADRREANE
jgi:hypothetical protein